MVFDVEGADMQEFLLNASLFTKSDVCTNCKGKDISLEGKKASEGKYTYISRKCNNAQCGFSSTMGKYQGAGEGYFWKQWEAPWKPNDGVAQSQVKKFSDVSTFSQ